MELKLKNQQIWKTPFDFPGGKIINEAPMLAIVEHLTPEFALLYPGTYVFPKMHTNISEGQIIGENN
jgi:hypothetical protein